MAKHEHLIGVDFAAKCREVGEQLEREHEEAKWTNRSADKEASDPTHAYAYVTFDAAIGCWVAESVDELPIVGRLIARGRNRAHALNELRLQRAWRMHQRLGIDWDTARAHATRYVFKEIQA